MTTDEPRGLTLTLYRSKDFGTTKWNLLAKVHEVTLTEIHWADGRKTPVPKDSRVFPARADRPAVALVQRKLHNDRDTWHIIPLSTNGWVMAGGTYAATSDSRLGQITKMYGALSVHDWVGGH